MSDVADLSLHRWERAGGVGVLRVDDTLAKLNSDIIEKPIHSIYIVTVDEDGMHTTYVAGPAVESPKRRWALLQREVYRLMERMVIG